jgi:hypothetical protein
MEITPQEILYKKRIGDSSEGPVVEVATKGGYYLVVATNGKGIEMLGVGPHRGVARFIAKKKSPSLVLHALEKSEDIHCPISLCDKYMKITNRINDYFSKYIK